MALSGQAAAQRERVKEPAHPLDETKEESQLKKTKCEIEDRLDARAVRHAQTLAAKRGERPMAWEAFKQKLDK